MPTLQKAPLRRKKSRSKKKKEVRYQILDKADEIALYYGFVPITTPSVSRGDALVAKLYKEIESCQHEGEAGADLSSGLCLEEKIAVLRTYLDMNFQTLPQPMMLYYKGCIS